MIERLKRHAKPIGVVIALWFTFILGGGIFLSQLDARDGLNVFGPEIWVAGEPAVLRVARRDLQFNRLLPLEGLEARFIGVDGVAEPAQPIEGQINGFLQGKLRPPTRPGRWRIALQGETEEGPITAELKVDVLAAAPAVKLEPLPKRRPPHPPDQGDLIVDFTPMGPILTGGLPDSLVLRVTDKAGAPQRALLQFGLKEGASAIPMPPRMLTGANGLGRMRVHPLHPRFWFTFEVVRPDEPTSRPTSQPTSQPASQPTSQPMRALASGERRIKHSPTQFALETGRLIAAPGDRVPFKVQSIHRKGTLFVDAWHGERWLEADALTLNEGSGAAQIMAPDPGQDPALVWLQAYQSTYLPGASRGGRHLLVTRKPAAEAIAWLRDQIAVDPNAPPHLEALPLSQDPLLLEYLLGRPGRPDRDPPLLANSGVSAKQTVALLKGTWQRRFAMGLLGSGALLLLGLFFLVYYNTRQVTVGWAEAGGDEEGEPGTRKHALLDAAYILIILALFLGGLVQLLLSIHW